MKTSEWCLHCIHPVAPYIVKQMKHQNFLNTVNRFFTSMRFMKKARSISSWLTGLIYRGYWTAKYKLSFNIQSGWLRVQTTEKMDPTGLIKAPYQDAKIQWQTVNVRSHASWLPKLLRRVNICNYIKDHYDTKEVQGNVWEGLRLFRVLFHENLNCYFRMSGEVFQEV